MTWYIVTGREYGDDEDRLELIEAPDAEAAFAQMRIILAQNSEDFSDWLCEDRGGEFEDESDAEFDLSDIARYEEGDGPTFYVLWLVECPGGQPKVV